MSTTTNFLPLPSTPLDPKARVAEILDHVLGHVGGGDASGLIDFIFDSINQTHAVVPKEVEEIKIEHREVEPLVSNSGYRVARRQIYLLIAGEEIKVGREM